MRVRRSRFKHDTPGFWKRRAGEEPQQHMQGSHVVAPANGDQATDDEQFCGRSVLRQCLSAMKQLPVFAEQKLRH